MATPYDAIISGTGQAGPALANRMNHEGLKVAVVERKLIGGTCVNVGCIPTKTLVASARAAHMARRAGDFGVVIGGPVQVDMKRVKARMKEISGQSNTSVTRWLDGMENVRVYHGHANLESPNTVSVNGELLQADKIFFNVGARARVPDMPGLADVDYLTNSSMMEVDFLPDHLIIVGGSYIGLEFGQMYRRFGSEVTVVEMAPRLIQREDEDVTEIIQEVLEREGVRIRLNAECLSLKGGGDQVSIQVSCDEGPEEVTGTRQGAASKRVSRRAKS